MRKEHKQISLAKEIKKKDYCEKCKAKYEELKGSLWNVWLIDKKLILKSIEMFDHGEYLYCEICGFAVKKEDLYGKSIHEEAVGEVKEGIPSNS